MVCLLAGHFLIASQPECSRFFNKGASGCFVGCIGGCHGAKEQVQWVRMSAGGDMGGRRQGMYGVLAVTHAAISRATKAPCNNKQSTPCVENTQVPCQRILNVILDASA